MTRTGRTAVIGLFLALAGARLEGGAPSELRK